MTERAHGYAGGTGLAARGPSASSAPPPTLRSATQGRAVYSMQFAHYEEVPGPKAAEVVAEARGARK